MDVVDGVNSGADQQFRALDAGKVGAEDDATDFSTEAGRAQRRREGEDHGIGGLVGSTLLFDAVGFDGVRVGSGPAGAARRWPGGPGGHRSMLPRPISLPVWGRVTEPALASSP